MIADMITVSRMLFSVLLFAVPRQSGLFAILYLLCGATDVLDGFAARTLHTESERGARLDSIADLLFAVVYAVRILPALSLPIWITVWAALIAVVKITGIFLRSKQERRFLIEHSFGNRLTGGLLFLLPLSVCFADVRYGATLVCAVATAVTVTEIVRINGGST